MVNVNRTFGAWDEGEIVHVASAVWDVIGRENRLFSAITKTLICPCALDDFH